MLEFWCKSCLDRQKEEMGVRTSGGLWSAFASKPSFLYDEQTIKNIYH
jgi:hypothetical protein